jgi:hypothetical protein
MNSGSTGHAVWQVYDQLRTARLNVKYYTRRIATLKSREFWLDLVLAIAAPSSAVAGLWFWSHPIGQGAWKALAVIAAVVAVVKPLLKIGDKVQAMEEAVSAYKALDHDLYCLTLDIDRERAYSPQSQQRFKEALVRKGVLVGRKLEESESMTLKRKCEQEVLTELPGESFFVPEG